MSFEPDQNGGSCGVILTGAIQLAPGKDDRRNSLNRGSANESLLQLLSAER